jgi:hypothetical protein
MQTIPFFLAFVLIAGLIAAGCTGTAAPAATTTSSSSQTGGMTTANSGTSSVKPDSQIVPVTLQKNTVTGLNDGATASHAVNRIQFAIDSSGVSDIDFTTVSLIVSVSGGAPVTYSLGTAGKDNQYFTAALDHDGKSAVTTLSGRDPVWIIFYTGQNHEMLKDQKVTIELKPSGWGSLSFNRTAPSNIVPDNMHNLFYFS